MAYQHVRFAFDHALDVSGSELLVLVALAEWANDEDECWPSHDSIAKRARVSRRQVIRLLQSLVNRGLIEVDQRRQYSNKYRLRCDIAAAQPGCDISDARCDIAMSDVTSDSDVTFGAPDVTSRVSDVTSSAGRCDIAVAPEPLVEPPIRTTTKNHQSGATKPKAMPANGPVQELVKAWYERIGEEPVNWGKAMGHGKSLVAARVTVGELLEEYDWLAGNPWNKPRWSFDLGTAVALLEQFRQSKRMPAVSNGRVNSGRMSAFDETQAAITEVFERINGTRSEAQHDTHDDVFETTWKAS